MKELQLNKYNLILGFLMLSVIRIYGIESDSSLINKYTNNNFINWFNKNAKAFEINNDEIKRRPSFFNCKERYMVFNNMALQFVNHDALNAHKLLIKSLDRKPGNNYLLMNLANVYLKINKPKEALDLYKSIQYDVNLDRDYINLKIAQSHKQLGNYEKALSKYSCLSSFESSYSSSIIYREIDNYDDALKMAREALGFERKNKQALYNYATLLYNSKDFKGAIKYLKKSIGVRNKDPKKTLQLGKIYFENGDYKNARKIFENLKESKVEKIKTEALLGISRINLYEMDYDASIYHAQLVLDADPNNAIANKVMGDNYLNIKEYNKARQYYENAIDAGLENEALLGKAVVEHKTGNMSVSKLIYDQLIDDGMTGFSYDTYMVMALNEHLLGNNQLSEKFINEALNIDPKRAEAFAYQAKFDFERMNFNGAFNNYKKAIKLASDKKVYMVKLANCYVQLDKFKKANELFEDAIEKDPTYAKAYTGKAMCLLKLGRYKEANEVIEQAIATAPNDPYNYMNKSYILALSADQTIDSNKRKEILLEAVAVINKAIDLDSTKMREYYDNNMGLIYMQMNELDTAWKLIIQDTNMVTFNNMGIIQELLGNNAEAISYYQSSIEADRNYMEPEINLNRLTGKRSAYGMLNPKDARKKWRTYWIFLRNDLLELNNHQFNKIGFEPEWANELPATYTYMAFKSKRNKDDKVKDQKKSESTYKGECNGYSCSKF